MKNIATRTLLLALPALLFLHCKKNESGPAVTDTVFIFENMAGSQPVEYGKILYPDGAGNRYSVNSLKYYVSRFTLETEDGHRHALNNYELINQDDPQSKEIRVDSLPNGRYVSLQFNVGIDSVRNHSGDQSGDLDPFYGMIWSWASGYVFYRHEGNFVNSLNDTLQMFYHLGTDAALTEVTVPLNGVVLDGTSRKIYIRMDMNELYRNIDFETMGIEHSSTEVKELGWLLQMKEGLRRAFSFSRLE